jgi:AcrR family transcriptional regulator
LTKVDLARRVEIGRERRAKSRAQIVEAARFLFTSRTIASVTIEDVTRQAQVAKGTFYSHFRSLDDLRAAVAAELSAAFKDFIDSHGLAVADPVARGASAFLAVASAARERLKTNLRLGQKERRLASLSTEVGFDLVFGVVLQAIHSASEARLSPRDVPDVVQGILRALGVGAEEVDRALRRVDEAAAARGAGSPAATNPI